MKEVFFRRKVRLHTSLFYCTATLARDVVVVRVIVLPKVFFTLGVNIRQARPAYLSLDCGFDGAYDDVFDDIDDFGHFVFSGYIQAGRAEKHQNSQNKNATRFRGTVRDLQ